ncbi:MAG: hypothetical protein K1X72_27415 [Pyrinomonadaceae bacterium]|nr:hypothetical protein [Pyrinomonadaceae bacterium]
MKIIILGFFIAILFVNISFAQDTKPNLTEAEILEAQQLAARFYNRLAQTQDVAPLVKEFFIKNFATKYKQGITNEGEFKNHKNIRKNDVILYYTTITNYFYLYFSSINYLKMANPKLNEEEAEKIVDAKIESYLTNKIELKLFLSKIPDLPINYSDFDPRRIISEDWKSLADFRVSFAKINELISVLRKVETEFRNQVKQNFPKQRFYYSPNNFGVSMFYENMEELNFPKKTKFLDVWIKNTGDTYIPSYMILVKIKRELKIFAITPPPQ